MSRKTRGLQFLTPPSPHVVYSFGEHPFDATYEGDNALIQMLIDTVVSTDISDSLDFGPPGRVPHAVREIARCCLSRNPSERPGFRQLAYWTMPDTWDELLTGRGSDPSSATSDDVSIRTKRIQATQVLPRGGSSRGYRELIATNPVYDAGSATESSAEGQTVVDRSPAKIVINNDPVATALARWLACSESRVSADKILVTQPPGTILFRPSSVKKSDLIIMCVRLNSTAALKVAHFQIEMQATGSIKVLDLPEHVCTYASITAAIEAGRRDPELFGVHLVAILPLHCAGTGSVVPVASDATARNASVHDDDSFQGFGRSVTVRGSTSA